MKKSAQICNLESCVLFVIPLWKIGSNYATDNRVCLYLYLQIADHQGGQVDLNLTAIPVLAICFNGSVKESKRCIIFLSWYLSLVLMYFVKIQANKLLLLLLLIKSLNVICPLEPNFYMFLKLLISNN